MRKLWFHSLVVTLGLVSTSVMGQYPSGYSNTGYSTYPVQPQGTLQPIPQVPYGYSVQAPTAYATPGPQNSQFQLAGTQEQIYGNGGYSQPTTDFVPPPPAQIHNHAAPQVQPMVNPGPVAGVPAAGCQTCNQPAPQYAPQMNYGYSQTVAPGCSTCGPAPVSNSYAYAPGASGSFTTVAPVHTGLFSGMPAQAKPWFFGGGALLMNRVEDKNIPLSFQDAAYAADVIGTRDARFGTAGGFEVMMGRYFNCGRNAIQVSYWGIFPSDTEALRARQTAGDYRSRIPYTYMTMAGTPAAPATPYGVYDWYDNAFTHTLQRSAEYHNVEVNLLGFAVGRSARNFNIPTAGSLFSGTHGRGSAGCGFCGSAGCGSCASSCESACATSCGTCAPSKLATGPCNLTAPACGSRLNMTWLAGVRYFRFNDNLLYAASLGDAVINRAADDLYYDVNTTNDLIGFQLGSRMDYCLGRRMNVYGTAKTGIYNNRSTLFTRLGTDFDDAYLDDTRMPTNPNNGQDYRFSETKNDVAFLSELGAGLGVRVSSKWTATVGYRVLFASGVATSTDNVRETFANYTDVRDFDNYGTLVLHGLNVGGIYNF